MADLSLCDRCGSCADVCPSEAREMTGRTMSVEEVMKEVRKDIIFYDESGGGVTFSGGEPLMQPEFLLELLQACGREEIHRTVDTTGFASTETLMGVADYTDLFLYDLKHMDPEEHRKYTGVSNEVILKNLRLLAERGAGLNIRFPVIPEVNDGEENIRNTAEFVRSLPGRHRMNILPYHKAGIDKYEKLGMLYRLEKTEEPSGERMNDIKKELEELGLEVKIGG
jgi:pyruvate formate lyase activating enzyme